MSEFQIEGLPETLTQTITVPMPLGNGNTMDFVFDATFHRLAGSEIESILEQSNKGEISDQQMVEKVLCGWDERVKGKDKKPLPFNPGNLQSVLDQAPIRRYIIRGFFEAFNSARLGN
ncbi:hypothetical protein [Deefgea piscis]|uniref:hypothetical protein n=1 Tax=Deefgea piscis TaxID=2739061 RepID=UPI001C805584|nr:hypothetical protein [Deefgea piscis]QZA80862.1 hypothetical protein K4H25_15430 [Deefgea piscis]